MAGSGAAPCGGKRIAALLDRDEAGEVARLAAHVRGALHVVLAAQRIHAGAGFAEVAGEQREIDQRHHAFGALHVFGHAETVESHRRAARRIEPRGGADVVRIHAADCGRPFRASTRG